MDQPLVSVIVPAYNSSRFIRETVESALRQTHSALEVIVVDDGSTDRVDWVTQLDPGRVTYRWQPNGGPASARNLGVRLSRGTYVAFLDSDDVWEPHKLERQLGEFAQLPQAGLVYTGVVGIDEQGRATSGFRPKGGAEGRIFERLFENNFITTSTVLVRRASLTIRCSSASVGTGWGVADCQTSVRAFTARSRSSINLV